MRLLIAVASLVLFTSCLAHSEPPEKTLADLQELINIPEPVELTILANLDGFDPASFENGDPSIFVVWDAYPVAPTSQWHIYATQEWIKSTDHRDRVFGIAHELCHTMYDNKVITKWGALTKADRDKRQARASGCAADIANRYQRVR